MAVATSYTTGTASVANNNTALTGTGTTWLTSGIQAGDVFWANGLSCRILTVNSNTSITLAYGWPGSSISGGTYEIRFTPDATRVLASARQLIDMLANGNIASIAGLTSAANKIPYFTGAGTAALADFKTKGRDIVNTADMGELLAKLGPVFGGAAPQPVNAGVGLADGDFDTINVGGVYSITSTWSNGPNGTASYAGILIVEARVFNNLYIQTYTTTAGNRWMRWTATASAASWPNAWFKINTPMSGTVAQSSGVPTGAIMERGSNANGEYIRFADGTQMCWLRNVGITAGSAYTWTYPVAFAASATTSLIVSSTSSSVARVAGGLPGASSAPVNLWTSSTGAEASGAVDLFAVGRWF